jgi:IclR family transcriptional regulator, mhp operon transcriptional activator
LGSFPPVNSVIRAIDLLRALNRRPVSSVDDLYVATGIPKPSIVRLLQTLQARGLVRHAPRHGTYYLTSEVRTLSSGYHSEPRLIEASADLLDETTRRLKWPLAIAMPDTNAAIIRYSTIPLSPLSLLHSSIGLRLSLVSRALGRAYLAFCGPDEQDTLLKLLARSTDPEDAAARDPKVMRAMLNDFRARGFATRDPRVRTVSNTLAVPIYEGSRAIASVGLTFFSSAMTPDEAITRYRSEMLRLSAVITKRLDALADDPPVEATSFVPARRARVR